MPSSSVMARKARVDAEVIQRAVLRVRSQNVLLDADLADLYGVDVRALNQAVARNADRFPSDFMFKLTAKEAASLRSQFVILDCDRDQKASRSQTVTLNSGRGRHRKYLPNAFTEQGVAMLSSVLRSQRAVRVNITIMRAFVQLRRTLGANEELARKLDALERKYDGQFRAVFQAIRELMTPSQRPHRTIGFLGDVDDPSKAKSGRRQ
ncbi:MAG TPA: ORF6N domain-containing protein [Vicinamibacterales bacterium]|nr:ORF6N domain-containing protein [Vicinamibacterales bacterium]